MGESRGWSLGAVHSPVYWLFATWAKSSQGLEVWLSCELVWQRSSVLVAILGHRNHRTGFKHFHMPVDPV